MHAIMAFPQPMVPSNLIALTNEQAIVLTERDLQSQCQTFEFSQQHQVLLRQYDSIRNHPWSGLTAHTLSPFDQADLIANLSEWRSTLGQLQEGYQQSERLVKIHQQPTLAKISQVQQQLETCPSVPAMLEAALLPVLETAQAQRTAATFLKRLKDYHKNRNQLQQFFEETLVQDNGTILSELSAAQEALLLVEMYTTATEQTTIAQLGDLGKQAGEVYQKLHSSRKAVKQLEQACELDSPLTPAGVETISIAVQLLREQSPAVLSKRTVELCNPASAAVLLSAKESCAKLNALHRHLEQKYDLASYCQIWCTTENQAAFLLVE